MREIDERERREERPRVSRISIFFWGGKRKNETIDTERGKRCRAGYSKSINIEISIFQRAREQKSGKRESKDATRNPIDSPNEREERESKCDERKKEEANRIIDFLER